MAPDAVRQIARALKQVRSRITPEERKHLGAEIASLRRLQQAVMAERWMLLDDAANSNAREQLARRVAFFYQRLGTLEEAIERLRRNFSS
jgi:hypothetical protein